MASRSPAEITRKALSLLHYVLLAGGALLLLIAGARRDPALTAAALTAGWLGGSFIEYAVHRFVLHGPDLTARIHARHHAMPAQEQIDLFSFCGPLAVAPACWLAISALGGGVPLAGGVTAGLCLQYSWFRALHRRMHLPGHRLNRGAKAQFHRGHHTGPRRNFGVTTALWDRLLGTHYPGTVVQDR